MKNYISLILKGCWAVSVPPLQYSPGRRSKKKETQVRSLMMMFLVVVHWAAVLKSCITLTRRGRTLFGGEYFF